MIMIKIVTVKLVKLDIIEVIITILSNVSHCRVFNFIVYDSIKLDGFKLITIYWYQSLISWSRHLDLSGGATTVTSCVRNSQPATASTKLSRLNTILVTFTVHSTSKGCVGVLLLFCHITYIIIISIWFIWMRNSLHPVTCCKKFCHLSNYHSAWAWFTVGPDTFINHNKRLGDKILLEISIFMETRG